MRAACSAGLALALSTVPAAAADPSGRYRLREGPDVASEIVLHSDGRFDYWLAAGALDEHAAGRWRATGQALKLETEPKPVPPRFVAGKPERVDGPVLEIRVTWPDGRAIAGVDLQVGFDDGEPVTGYTQTYGWRLSSDERRVPRWVQLAVPMHGLISARVPLATEAGNSQVFILEPNDLGVIEFGDIAVEQSEDGLVLHRGGAQLRYQRQPDKSR